MILDLGLHILVVDGVAERRTMLCHALQAEERLVTVAESVEQAWSLLNYLQFDIVACAFECWTLGQLIRTSTKHSSVYLMLAGPRAEQAGCMRRVDADDWIDLPMDPGALRLRMRAATRILELRHTLLEKDAVLRRVVAQMGTAYSSIESDLQAASAIQLGLLPTVSDVHSAVRAEWLMLPSSFLTGDNLNYFMVQDRYLIFYQADVAGHGIPSALLSVTLSQLLSPESGSHLVRSDSMLDTLAVTPPVDVIRELNRRFVSQDGSYFTMLYGVFDVKTREVRLCQAGHPSPLQQGLDRSIVTVGQGGFPVGLWPEMAYDETRITLGVGERLILYSDGLLECTNPHGARYSLERLQEILVQHAGAPIRMVLQTVQHDLEAWSEGGMLKDDISMLIIESR